MGHNTHLSKTEIHRIMQQDDKRGRLLKQGESRVTAQERYLKVSPACLLSFLELFSKKKENQKLDTFWKASEISKN